MLQSICAIAITKSTMVSQQTSAHKKSHGQRVSAADVTQNALNAMRLARMTDCISHSNHQQTQPCTTDKCVCPCALLSGAATCLPSASGLAVTAAVHAANSTPLPATAALVAYAAAAGHCCRCPAPPPAALLSLVEWLNSLLALLLLLQQ
jgi:hypothetical protein